MPRYTQATINAALGLLAEVAGIRVAGKLIEGRMIYDPAAFDTIAAECAKYGITVAEESDVELSARHQIRTEPIERLLTGQGNVVDAAEIFRTYNRKDPT